MIYPIQVIKRYDSEGNLIEVIDPAKEAAQQAVYNDIIMLAVIGSIILLIISLILIRKWIKTPTNTNPTRF